MTKRIETAELELKRTGTAPAIRIVRTEDATGPDIEVEGGVGLPDGSSLAAASDVPVVSGVDNRTFLQGDHPASANNAMTFGNLRVSPVTVPNELLVSHLGAEVLATVGTQGNRLRVGVYDDDAGRPGALLASALLAADFVQVMEAGVYTNILDDESSGFETADDEGTWIAGTATTIAQTEDEAFVGSGSLGLTPDATNALIARDYDVSSASQIIATAHPVTPGEVYAAEAWFIATSTGVVSTIQIAFFDAAGAVIAGTTADGSEVTPTAAGHGVSTAMGTAPATAAFAGLRLDLASTDEEQYVDEVKFGPVSTGLTLTPGRYWVGGATQGDTTQPNVRVIAGMSPGLVVDVLPPANLGIVGYIDDYTDGELVTEDLPATFTSNISVAGVVPRVHFRLGA